MAKNLVESVPQRVLLAESIWSIKSPEQRRAAILEYLGRGYPHYKPIRTERPYILCEDTRRPLG